MPVFFKIAIRNLLRHRRRSLLTGLSMLGGYLLLSISYSIAEGSYANIIQILTRGYAGHVQVHAEDYLDSPSLYKTLDDPAPLLQILRDDPEITEATARARGAALAFAGEKASGVALLGIDPVNEAKVTSITGQVDTGRYLSGAPGELLLGKGAAHALKAGLGDQIFLMSQGVDGSIANDVFQVVGLVGEEQSSPYRGSVIVSLEDAQRFLSMGERVHELAAVAAHYREAEAISKRLAAPLQAAYTKATIAPWQIVEREFYQTMEADKQGNVYSVVIITLIVGLGVLNSVLMATLERMREFGLMRAMGTRPRYVFMMIVLESGLLSIFSILAGLPLAIGASYYLQTVGIALPEAFDIAGQSLTTMKGEIGRISIVDPALMVIATAWVVALYPAIHAIRIAPVEALRKV